MLLKPQQVADVMKIDVSTVRRMCADGRIRAKRIGKHWRVSITEVARLSGLTQREIEGLLK